jgi:hypothetical protein
VCVPLVLCLLLMCRTATCVVCLLTHTKARCVTAADKAVSFNLTATVGGQVSNPLPYFYSDVVSNTPPNIVTVNVTTAAASNRLVTAGNDTVVITG